VNDGIGRVSVITLGPYHFGVFAEQREDPRVGLDEDFESFVDVF
jgi:hypothetical protein